jgi:hypothetical protein
MEDEILASTVARDNIRVHSGENEKTSDSILQLYTDYLLSQTKANNYSTIRKFSDEYETFIKYHFKKGLSIDEIFLKVISDNNIVMFRRMISDMRVSHSFMNNEPIVRCILSKRHLMLSILCKHPNVKPNDQNNFAIRLSINIKDKKSVDILLGNQNVISDMYHDFNLCNFLFVYLSNGRVFI